MKLLEAIKQCCVRVDEYIWSLFPEEARPKELYDASRHLIKAGGKRLRPFLVIQSCIAVGGDVDAAIPAAASVELIHNFTLVHDDIMDRDEFRRGVPTVHTVWGVPTAILAGDLLFSKAFEAILRCADNPSVPPARVVEAGRRLAEAVSTIAEGQALDMRMSGRLREEMVSEEEYMEMIYKKTAALFKVSCEVGAIIGGGSDWQVAALSSYGENIGIAFQMLDDILGVTADEKVLGKPVGSDLREGKCTLIMIHALKNASSSQREMIMKVYGKSEISVDELNAVVKVLEDLGSISYVRELANRHVALAKDSISILPESDAKSLLMELADFVISRKY